MSGASTLARVSSSEQCVYLRGEIETFHFLLYFSHKLYFFALFIFFFLYGHQICIKSSCVCSFYETSDGPDPELLSTTLYIILPF